VVAFPKETVALYKLVKAGRLAEALKLYQWFMPLLHLDVSTKLVQNLKLVEALVGVGNENVRRPRQPLRGADREFVVQVVQQALATRPDVSAYL
jgi:dihydrodipicolinate synthase/N-acetylneuraminate lyase